MLKAYISSTSDLLHELFVEILEECQWTRKPDSLSKFQRKGCCLYVTAGEELAYYQQLEKLPKSC